MNSTERQRTGRKRNDASREAILRTVLELLRAEGYSALTFDKVAAQAKVGKQTIYRWWPSKGELVMQALADEASERILEPNTGSLERDLAGFLRRSFEVLGGEKPTGPILKALAVETQLLPEFLESFRAHFIERRRQVLRDMWERAVIRGEIDKTVDRELAIDQVFGVMWYRILFGHAPLDRALAASLAHQIALQAKGSTARER